MGDPKVAPILAEPIMIRDGSGTLIVVPRGGATMRPALEAEIPAMMLAGLGLTGSSVVRRKLMRKWVNSQ